MFVHILSSIVGKENQTGTGGDDLHDVKVVLVARHIDARKLVMIQLDKVSRQISQNQPPSELSRLKNAKNTKFETRTSSPTFATRGVIPRTLGSKLKAPASTSAVIKQRILQHVCKIPCDSTSREKVATMAMKNLRRGVPSLLKDGHKQYAGVEQVVLRNVEACKKLSKVTRTSLGPNGVDSRAPCFFFLSSRLFPRFHVI